MGLVSKGVNASYPGEAVFNIDGESVAAHSILRQLGSVGIVVDSSYHFDGDSRLTHTT